MPFELQLANISDIEEIIDVWDVAFKDSSPLDSVFFPRTDHVRAWWISVYREDFADPSSRFLKVVDTSADNKIVAYGKWYVPIVKDSGAKGDKGGGDSSSSSSKLVVGGAGPEEIKQADWPDEYPAKLCTEIFVAFALERERVMGKPFRPHYYLERVGTRPEYAGNGAARKIIEWGLKQADADGLESYIEAHQGVVALYEKYGWKPVANYSNEEIGHLETFMLRPAKRT